MLKRLNIEKNLHILIVEDKDKKVFLAHCLDMDIVGQGRTDKEAISNLIELIDTQIDFCFKNDTLDTLFRPAPKEYWDALYRSQTEQILNQLSSSRRRNILRNLTRHLEVTYAYA